MFKNRHYIMTWTCLIVAVALPTFVSSKNGDPKSCLEAVESIFKLNGPELLVIPNRDEHSIFTSNKIHISVTWSHMHALLSDKSCISSYLLEYSPYEVERFKRETIASTAHITPALTPDRTSFSIELEDDCLIYSVQVVVIPSVATAGLIYSRPRRFWPAAHRTTVDIFSDAAILSWPQNCPYVTANTQIEACLDSQISDCITMKLNDDKVTHLSDLQPCKVYHLILRYTPETAQSGPGDILWSYSAARTLPKPDIQVAPGHNALRVHIRQGENCHEDAIIKHWRVTYCTEAISEEDSKRHYYDDIGSGNDDIESEEEDPEYYYYQEGVVSRTKDKKCTNKRFDIQNGRNDFVIEGLTACTMYTVYVSPANQDGTPVQPEENFGSTYSTFCSNGKISSMNEDQPFWFGDEVEDIAGGTFKTEETESISMLNLVLLSTGSFVVFATLALAILCFMKNSGQVKHERCPSEAEDASPKRALIGGTESCPNS